MIELILLERVEKLGQMGQLVKVRPGYARNYLLPQKKAMRATTENRKYFDNQKAQLEALNLRRREEAERVAVALGEARVALERVEITRATMAEVLVRRPDACAAQGGVFPADPSTAGVLAPVVVPPHRADLTEDALPVEYRRIWFR